MNYKAYKEAGVDIQASHSIISKIKPLIQANLQDIDKKNLKNTADFSGFINAKFLQDFEEPLLAFASDGVGTKMHFAKIFKNYSSVGIDLVAMCTNDLLASGARPIAFLDYIACERIDGEESIVAIIKGILKACKETGASLVGGEIAEHPQLMFKGTYDLAGFALGVIESSRVMNKDRVKTEDILLGLPSSGIHSNGLSLLRHIFLKNGTGAEGLSQGDRNFLEREILAKATVLYERPLRPLLENDESRELIHGMVHITGGGFYENIGRVLPENCKAIVQKNSWFPPPIFEYIATKGKLSDIDMYSTFNMGIGFVLVIDSKNIDEFLKIKGTLDKHFLSQNLAETKVIGKIVSKKSTGKNLEQRVEILA